MEKERGLIQENITSIFKEIKDLVINSRNRVYATVNT